MMTTAALVGLVVVVTTAALMIVVMVVPAAAFMFVVMVVTTAAFMFVLVMVNLSMYPISRADDHFLTQDHIGHQAYRQCQPFQPQISQHQTHHKQRRTKDQGLDALFLPVTVVMAQSMRGLVMKQVMVMTAMALVVLLVVMTAATLMIVVMVMTTAALVGLVVVVPAAAFMIVVMVVTTAAFMFVLMMVNLSMYPISRADDHFPLHRPGDLRQLRDQGVRIFRRQPQLPGGKGDGGLLYSRMGIEFGLDLGGAVGAVQIFDDVYLLHGDTSLFLF